MNTWNSRQGKISFSSKVICSNYIFIEYRKLNHSVSVLTLFCTCSTKLKHTMLYFSTHKPNFFRVFSKYLNKKRDLKLTYNSNDSSNVGINVRFWTSVCCGG